MSCISLSDQCEMRYYGHVSPGNEMSDTPILCMSAFEEKGDAHIRGASHICLQAPRSLSSHLAIF
jgi:hypothetical protein